MTKSPSKSVPHSAALDIIGGDIAKLSGARVRAARAAAGLRLSEVAGALGVTSQAVSKIEAGVMRLSIERARRLAPLLGVSAAHLLCVDDYEYRGPYQVHPKRDAAANEIAQAAALLGCELRARCEAGTVRYTIKAAA